MPTVPRYDGQQIASRGVPVPQQSTIATTAPNGLDALGKGIRQATEEINKQQQYADELRVEDEFNKLREKQLDLTLGQQNGYVNVKGKNALPGESGSLSDRYMQQYDGAANEIASSLANDRQKALFQRYAARAGLEFKSGLMRHENQEVDSWRKQTVDGVFAVEADNAAKNWNNPEAIDLSRGRIDINIGRLRDAEGVPAEEAQKIRLGALTKLHAGVIDNMRENKQFDAAKAYIEKYKDEIDAGTLLRANTELKKEGNLQEAFNGARSAVAPAIRSMQPGDMDRILHITAGAESGGRDFKADGTPVVSPTGVKWKMQVTDSTAQNPGYGIKPAQSKTPEEYNRVGEELLAKLLQKNGGDHEKMWAGYNGGQKYVDQAVEAAAKSGKSWIDELPGMIKAGEARGEVPKGKAEETLAYVRKNTAALDAGLGAPKRETFADVDARLQKQYANQPEVYKQAREFAKQQFDENEQAIKKNQEELVGQAQRLLLANGGNFMELPAYLRNSDPSKRAELLAFATSVKKGEPTITNPAMYLKLSDENYLKSLSQAQLFAFRKDLSEQDFQHFAAQHGKLHGQSIKEAQDINTAAMNAALANRLTPYKIDPTPKDGTDDAVRVGAIRQFVTGSILDAQAASGKKMTDAEIIKHVDNLFLTSTELKKGLLYGYNGGVALLSIKPSDVPSDARDKIKAEFRAAGREPTDADILQAYWIKKFGEKSAIKQAKVPPVATNTFNGQGK